MKRRCKSLYKITSTVLCLSLCLSLIDITAFAAADTDEEVTEERYEEVTEDDDIEDDEEYDAEEDSDEEDDIESDEDEDADSEDVEEDMTDDESEDDSDDEADPENDQDAEEEQSEEPEEDDLSQDEDEASDINDNDDNAEETPEEPQEEINEEIPEQEEKCICKDTCLFDGCPACAQDTASCAAEEYDDEDSESDEETYEEAPAEGAAEESIEEITDESIEEIIDESLLTETEAETIAETVPETTAAVPEAESEAIYGNCTDDDGVTISVLAPAGAFPAGTELVIEPLGDMFFEVTFWGYEEGFESGELTELEPAEGYEVNVTFTVPALEELSEGETAELQVVHITDEGVKEEIGKPVTAEAEEETEVSVKATSFCSYGIKCSHDSTEVPVYFYLDLNSTKKSDGSAVEYTVTTNNYMNKGWCFAGIGSGAGNTKAAPVYEWKKYNQVSKNDYNEDSDGYPDIYVYINGNKYIYKYSEASENDACTYSIVWDQIIASKSTSTNNGPNVGEELNWHINGHAVLNSVPEVEESAPIYFYLELTKEKIRVNDGEEIKVLKDYKVKLDEGHLLKDNNWCYVGTGFGTGEANNRPNKNSKIIRRIEGNYVEPNSEVYPKITIVVDGKEYEYTYNSEGKVPNTYRIEWYDYINPKWYTSRGKEGADINDQPNWHMDGSVILSSMPGMYYTITASADEGGKISPSGETVVERDGTQNYTIEPETGYRINTVTVDDKKATLTDGQYTFKSVNANHKISVDFAKDEEKTVEEEKKDDADSDTNATGNDTGDKTVDTISDINDTENTETKTEEAAETSDDTDTVSVTDSTDTSIKENSTSGSGRSSGSGSSSGGSGGTGRSAYVSSSSVNDTTVPAAQSQNDTASVTDITDEAAPLSGVLTENAAFIPGTSIMADEAVPASAIPTGIKLIEDEKVAMADVPFTNDDSLNFGFAAFISGLALVWLSIASKKREDEEAA